MRSFAKAVSWVQGLNNAELAALARILESERIARQVAAMGSKKDATE